MIESNNDVKEKQNLNFRTFNNNRYPNSNFRNTFQNTSQNFKNNSNYRSNYKPNSNSNYRSNNNRFGNKFRGNNNNKRYVNYERKANIRVIESENSETPQDLTLGDLHSQKD